MNKLNLFEHEGNWITDAEILLSKFYQRKHFERNEIEKGKQEEKKIMANNARALEKVKESSSSTIKKIISPEDILNSNKTTIDTIDTTRKQSDMKLKDIQKNAVHNKRSFAHTIHTIDQQEQQEEDDSSSVSTIPFVFDNKTVEVKQPSTKDVIAKIKNNVSSNDSPTHNDILMMINKDTSIKETTTTTTHKPLTTIGSNIKKKKALALTEDSLRTQEEDDNHLWNSTTKLFPIEDILDDSIWNSLTASKYKEWPLHEFSFTTKGKQTLALKLSVPPDSKSWSLNICPYEDYHNNNILLHFNPRYSGKARSLIMTDKQGTWNPSIKKEFGKSSSTDGFLSNDITLMIQIIPEGFAIFANDMYNTFFPHRRDITKLHTLKLMMNAIDGNGNKQNVIVHKVWWGHKDLQYDTIPSEARDIMASTTIMDYNNYNSILARTILVHGLPMNIFDLVECQAVEFALTQVFLEFSPEVVSVVPGYGCAFIKFMSEESVLPAIEELDDAMMGNEDQEQYVLKLSKIKCL